MVQLGVWHLRLSACAMIYEDGFSLVTADKQVQLTAITLPHVCLLTQSPAMSNEPSWCTCAHITHLSCSSSRSTFWPTIIFCPTWVHPRWFSQNNHGAWEAGVSDAPCHLSTPSFKVFPWSLICKMLPIHAAVYSRRRSTFWLVPQYHLCSQSYVHWSHGIQVKAV